MDASRHCFSDYDPHRLPSADTLRGQRYAVVVADQYAAHSFAIADAALRKLTQAGVLDDRIAVVHVPGAADLTYAAANLVGRVNAILVIGCVKAGETPDYVSQSVIQGIAVLNANGETPVILSLTAVSAQEDKSKAEEQGAESAEAAIRMANLNLG